MNLSPVHLVFDLLAALTALAVTWLIYRWRLSDRVELIEREGRCEFYLAWHWR